MENNIQNEITSNTFYKLYRKTSGDVEAVELVDGKGITIIRNYDEQNDYFKDGSLMFIKIYILDKGFVCGSVNMVKKSERLEGYITIEDEKQYKKHFTNFFFHKEEKIKFDVNRGKFIVKKKKLNINDFVDLLIKNHLADRLFLKRKLRVNKLKESFLKFIFWLLNEKYDWIEYYNSFHGKDRKLREINHKEKKLSVNTQTEPFFKYFKINKDLLFFSVLFIALPIVWCFYSKANDSSYSNDSVFLNLFKIEYFTITNPIFLFSFFIFLSMVRYLEFLIRYVYKSLKEQIDDNEGWIYKLHMSSMNNSFSLKL